MQGPLPPDASQLCLNQQICCTAVLCLRRPPTAKVHEGCVVALKRLQAAGEGDADGASTKARQRVLLVAQPDLSTCGQVAAALAQAAESTLRLYSLSVQANMQQLADGAEAGAPAGPPQAAAGGAAAGAGRGGGGRGQAAGARSQGRGGGRGTGSTSNMAQSTAALQNKVSRFRQGVLRY